MLVKIDRYRVQPAKVIEHQTILERARALYRRFVQQPFMLLRSQDDPCQWIAIYWYPDEAAYHHYMSAIYNEPDMRALWQAFQETLDPQAPFIQEEYYDEVDIASLTEDNRVSIS